MPHQMWVPLLAVNDVLMVDHQHSNADTTPVVGEVLLWAMCSIVDESPPVRRFREHIVILPR